MRTSYRSLLAAVVLAGSVLFSQIVAADGDKTYPPFAKIAAGGKFLDRDQLKGWIKKYPALEDLDTHWDDADLDHNGKLNQTEYDNYMTLKKD